eukprot:CAMPEP_0170813860 /NCGR_PEP_ID=MMETSP0733-20121128/37191_1 /TAXON_ID=186038 /ORGANISM="Fragilariopsis kerguelensis, Strain L26-C5" /LENGTH=55 /DNA_ID=CAMNT_0011171461 /DNA_START=153 /DNA_END=320 /DNA_ORIENTATION=-
MCDRMRNASSIIDPKHPPVPPQRLGFGAQLTNAWGLKLNNTPVARPNEFPTPSQR